MRSKLLRYSVLSIFSFCFFTAVFITFANAQTSVGSILQGTKPKARATPTAIPSPTPTPTITPTATPTIIPTNTPIPQPTSTPRPTATPTPLPTLAPLPDLESLFQKYSTEYAVAKDLLKRIASCESGFNSQADTGTYAGMFQFASQTWINARNSMGLDPNPDLRKNPEEPIRTAASMIQRGQQTAWKNCL